MSPGLAGRVLIVSWKRNLHRVYRIAGLRSKLSSCHLRCTPAMEERDYDGIQLTFKKRYASDDNAQPCIAFSAKTGSDRKH